MASKKRKVSQFGSWRSPVSAELVASAGVRLSQPILSSGDLYWLESRPTEGGRQVIVRAIGESGKIEDALPAPFNARSLVHEYGGGSYAVKGDTIVFSNFSDQKVYKIVSGGEPAAVTSAEGLRYADFCFDPHKSRVVAVREDHSGSGKEPVTTVVEINIDTDDQHDDQVREHVLVSGADFYSNPRFSEDGKRLSWLSWHHPNMPWDGCELWVGELDADGKVWRAVKVAGGENESICQPEWLSNGALCFISDRSGYWNLYGLRDPLSGGAAVELARMENDFGVPQWVFGLSTYCCLSSDRIICAYNHAGLWRLAEISMDWHAKVFALRDLNEVNERFSDFSYLTGSQSRVAMVAGAPGQASAVVRLDLETGAVEKLKSASSVEIDDAYISAAQPISFETAHGKMAHAFFYPPKNAEFEAGKDELPPLLVKSHGGPTSAASSTLSLSIQYWTSRGFAVADVNYGGSTGFGRAYRERLNGAWGVVDVQDCEAAALYLAKNGKVDGDRVAITGGSAGGYTTLCALTFGDVFKVGASHYGVSDLEALATDTHKFESRYLDNLVGPYPGEKELYIERSPIHATEKLSCPIIFFQGLEDKVVPPNQAEMMVEALRKKKLPVAYIQYEDEQHGFRKAENIKRTLEAEFYFYSRIFRFEPADAIEPVAIENLTTESIEPAGSVCEP